jgi:type I site-specific restriction endonuclease
MEINAEIQVQIEYTNDCQKNGHNIPIYWSSNGMKIIIVMQKTLLYIKVNNNEMKSYA